MENIFKRIYSQKFRVLQLKIKIHFMCQPRDDFNLITLVLQWSRKQLYNASEILHEKEMYCGLLFSTTKWI